MQRQISAEELFQILERKYPHIQPKRDENLNIWDNRELMLKRIWNNRNLSVVQMCQLSGYCEKRLYLTARALNFGPRPK